jgi:hypothetical protein
MSKNKTQESRHDDKKTILKYSSNVIGTIHQYDRIPIPTDSFEREKK